MKRLSLIPLIVILTACISSPAPVTPTQKVETATFVSATKTPIPTNTIEPIPTKDPNIPEGYIKDSSGNYTKTEDGFTLIWDVERNAEYSLLFEDDLWDNRPDLEGRLPDTLKLKVFVSTKLTNWNTLSISHEENKNSFGVFDWTVLFQNFLWDVMIRREMIKDKVSYDNTVYYGDGYTRHYSTIEGPQTITLKHGNGITVYIIDGFEALKADKENNYFYEVTGGKTIDAP